MGSPHPICGLKQKNTKDPTVHRATITELRVEEDWTESGEGVDKDCEATVRVAANIGSILFQSLHSPDPLVNNFLVLYIS
jgi:hypothetical protein